MRHITTSMVLALSTLFLLSITAAQQKASTSQPTATSAGDSANTAKMVGGPDTVANCAGAQNGRIAVFKGSAPPNITICNSGIYEAKPYGTGAIGILNSNPIAALDVTGDINTSLYYQIGGNSVLSIGSQTDQNLFLGMGAGTSNVVGSGQFNVFSGYLAGYSNTTGSYNTFSGNQAGFNNIAGGGNTFIGASAGHTANEPSLQHVCGLQLWLLQYSRFQYIRRGQFRKGKHVGSVEHIPRHLCRPKQYRGQWEHIYWISSWR